MSPAPLSHTTLLFPLASTTLTTTLVDLKRSKLSLPNRLHSIHHDATFVVRIALATNLPLIANERCGSWYIPPSKKEGSAYFKSTDGHFGQWAFSLRRLNLQVLDVVGMGGGCVIVDSTRRGKSMPDALSKTIPVWICVLNRLLSPEHPQSHILRTPRDVVGRSEHSQIEERIPHFVAEAQALKLDLIALRAKLKGVPMRPTWVTPASNFHEIVPNDTDYHSVVLCTASSRDSIDAGSDYVQGAADDHESWSQGLDAAVFWSHSDPLLSTSEDELPALIGRLLVAENKPHAELRKPVLIKPTRDVWISNDAFAESAFSDFDIVVHCGPTLKGGLVAKMKHQYCHLECSATAKIGSRQLRAQLPKLDTIFSDLTQSARILVACPTGKDLAVGAALAIICLHVSENGDLLKDTTNAKRSVPNKTQIKHRLSWIMVSMPDAAPSRATLQSVNAYLMG